MVAARCESLLQIGSLVLAVVAVPVAMGGRHPLGQVVLTGAAVTAVAAWTLGTCRTRDASWRLGPVDAFFVMAIGIGILQIVSLPTAWIAFLSPQLHGMLPCFDGDADSLGRWACLSVTPGETRAGLGILFAQGVLALVLLQRIRTARDVEPVLNVVALATTLIALLGLVQYFAGNGLYLWFYEFAYNDAGGMVKGTFTNRNHFAGFLAVGLGAVVWWTSAEPAVAAGFRGRAGRAGRSAASVSWRQGVGWLLAAAVAFAAAASLSRGGTMALVAAAVVSVGMHIRNRSTRVFQLFGGVAAAGFFAAALVIHGWDRLRGRFEAVFTEAGSGQGRDRTAVWEAAWRTIQEFPWLGAGVGSHAEMAPRAMPATDGIVFTHAENSYLNLGVETGWIGLGLALTGLLVAVGAAVVVVRRGDVRERAIAVAILAALTAATVHAAVDFVWYVPAYSTLLILLGTCAVALAAARVAWLPTWQFHVGWFFKAMAGVAASGLLLGIGARQVAAARAEIAWEESVKQGQRITMLARRQARPTPVSDATARQAEFGELCDILGKRIDSLERCVALRPDHPRAWTELCLARMDHFGLSRFRAGTSLGITDIRSAAALAGFSSTAELRAWVRRATGSAYDDLEAAWQASRRAVANTPCAGEAWCVLAQLVFLGDESGPSPSRLLMQALLVRPNDSLVLFEAANEAALDGDVERAVDLWRRSFAADSRQRQRIIAVLLPRLSSTEACDLLEPDLAGLRAIEAAWSTRETPEDLIETRTRRIDAVLAAATTATPTAACLLFLEAAELQRRLGETAAARESLRRAVRHDPASFEARRRLAMAALAAEDWTTARQGLEWCLLRRPHSADLREKLENLRQSRLGENLRPATADRTN
jgi:O-antigen ligase/tetratricopeptide (TPR) repeat protein